MNQRKKVICSNVKTVSAFKDRIRILKMIAGQLTQKCIEKVFKTFISWVKKKENPHLETSP